MLRTGKNKQPVLFALLLSLALLVTLALSLDGKMKENQHVELDAPKLAELISLLMEGKRPRSELVALFGTALDPVTTYQLRIAPKFPNVKEAWTINGGAETALVDLSGVGGLTVAALTKTLGIPRLSPPIPGGGRRNVVFSRRTASTECRLVVSLPLNSDLEQAAAEELTIRCDFGLNT